MSLTLVKNGTTDEYSYGDGTDPLSFTVTLDDDNDPTTINSNTVTAQIRATTYLYTGISMSVVNEDSGIDYKLSLDNTNWFNSLASGTGGDSVGQIPNMDATGSTVTDLVYIRATINNNGTVTAGTKTTPNIRLSFTENQ